MPRSLIVSEANANMGLGDRIVRMIEEEKIHQFLMGLNDENFSTMRSQALVPNPWPSLDTIFNIIQQEGNHKWVMMGRDSYAKNMITFTAKEH